MIAYVFSQLVGLMKKKQVYDLSAIGFKTEEVSTVVNGELAGSIIGMILSVVYFVASILLSVGARKGCIMIKIRCPRNDPW